MTESFASAVRSRCRAGARFLFRTGRRTLAESLRAQGYRGPILFLSGLNEDTTKPGIGGRTSSSRAGHCARLSFFRSSVVAPQ